MPFGCRIREVLELLVLCDESYVYTWVQKDITIDIDIDTGEDGRGRGLGELDSTRLGSPV